MATSPRGPFARPLGILAPASSVDIDCSKSKTSTFASTLAGAWGEAAPVDPTDGGASLALPQALNAKLSSTTPAAAATEFLPRMLCNPAASPE